MEKYPRRNLRILSEETLIRTQFRKSSDLNNVLLIVLRQIDNWGLKEIEDRVITYDMMQKAHSASLIPNFINGLGEKIKKKVIEMLNKGIISC